MILLGFFMFSYGTTVNRVLFFIYNRYACPAFGRSKGVGGGGKVKMPVSGSKITDFWLKIEQNAGDEILWIVDKI